PAPAKPAPAQPAPAPAQPAPAPAQPDVTYKNCSEVRAAGKAPLYRGQPGYAAKLDRDGDGIACE
ncbi:excalibur calcium-binding domain-containing protein, partial [Microbacterium ginsengisoli]